MITIFSYILYIIIQYVVTIKKESRYINYYNYWQHRYAKFINVETDMSTSMFKYSEGFFRNLLFTNTYTR